MVGIKPILPLFPSVFFLFTFFFFLPVDGRRSLSIFVANFQKSEMRRGLVTGVCLNIKQSHGGLQMAGRLDSTQGLQSGGGAGDFTGFFLLFSRLRVDVVVGGTDIHIALFHSYNDIVKVLV